MARYVVNTFSVSLTVNAPPPTGFITTSHEAVEILRPIFDGLDADQEHFVLLTLNTKNGVTGYKVLFSGGMKEVTVDARVLFRAALLMGATAIIVAHNHPSSDRWPSAEDRRITKELADAGEILKVQVLDHIILAGKTYYSFADGGEMPRPKTR